MTPQRFAEIGERLTQALLTGDYALYRQVIDLPLTTIPRGGITYTLDTEEALHRDFTLYHQAIVARGVTDIYRKVETIAPLSDKAFEVTCLMHILEHANLVTEPFVSRMSLHETAQGWKFFRIESSLRHIDWTLGRVRSPGGDRD